MAGGRGGGRGGQTVLRAQRRGYSRSAAGRVAKHSAGRSGVRSIYDFTTTGPGHFTASQNVVGENQRSSVGTGPGTTIQ